MVSAFLPGLGLHLNRCCEEGQRFDEMESKIAETIKAVFGTLGFLFVLLPIILSGIPYKILSSPNHIF